MLSMVVLPLLQIEVRIMWKKAIPSMHLIFHRVGMQAQLLVFQANLVAVVLPNPFRVLLTTFLTFDFLQLGDLYCLVSSFFCFQTHVVVVTRVLDLPFVLLLWIISVVLLISRIS